MRSDLLTLRPLHITDPLDSINSKMLIKVKDTDIRDISRFIAKNEIIYHPRISPNGYPDLNLCLDNKIVIILDRNILVRIVRLVENGTLKDQHSLRLISNLMFWCDINGITLTSGVALMEYAYYQQSNIEATEQHRIFKNIYKQYTPKHWLDLATGKQSTIPTIINNNIEEANYFRESDHHKFNYLQLLILSQLVLNPSLSLVDKFREFLNWSYDNVLIGMYSNCFALLTLKGHTKLYLVLTKLNYDEIIKNIKSTAWDLTYFSSWSTLYWDDQSDDEVFLFATMDKELKNIFKIVNNTEEDMYLKYLGNEIGAKVINIIKAVIKPRKHPDLDMKKIDNLIKIEETNLDRYISKITLSNTRDNDHPA